MKTAYICSPYRAKDGATLDNHIEYAQEITRKALAAGLAPITPHLYITQVTNDELPKERAQGMAAGIALLKKCDVILIGVRYGISEGMAAEINEAKTAGLQIISNADEYTPEEIKKLIQRG